MAKHTPGPWKLHKTTKRGEFCWDYKIKSADNSAICTIGPVAQDANGALIAAAPELYEALIVALPLLEGFDDGDRVQCDDGDDPIVAPVIAQVRAALAKARGEP